jgi:hypothetical protein
MKDDIGSTPKRVQHCPFEASCFLLHPSSFASFASLD